MAYPDNHVDTIPCIAPEEADAQRYASNRAFHAILLAATPEAWFLLIRGQTVPADQLDHQRLTRTRKRTAA